MTSRNLKDTQNDHPEPPVPANVGRPSRPELAALDTSNPLLSQSQQQRATHDSGAAEVDAIFSHLQIIQQLQTEITAEHAALEKLNTAPEATQLNPGSPETVFSSNFSAYGAGEPKVADFGASTSFGAGFRDSTKKGDKETKFGSSTGSSGKPEPKASSADNYDSLAAAFKERQKGVDSIMDKLSELSKAVKEFHALPPPMRFAENEPLASSTQTGPATSVRGNAARERILRHMDIVDTPVAMSPRQRLP